jgi:hypothetical protein
VGKRELRSKRKGRSEMKMKRSAEEAKPCLHGRREKDVYSLKMTSSASHFLPHLLPLLCVFLPRSPFFFFSVLSLPLSSLPFLTFLPLFYFVLFHFCLLLECLWVIGTSTKMAAGLTLVFLNKTWYDRCPS